VRTSLVAGRAPSVCGASVVERARSARLDEATFIDMEHGVAV
jgi:hypothetical protein